jgi:hypothetical protein
MVDILGHANAGHDILALGIDQIIAFDLGFAGGTVAGHGHAGGAVVAHVAEDHGHDADRRAQIVGDAGGIAVIDGAFAVPAFEHRFGGHFELLHRILRKIDLRVAAENGFELGGHVCHCSAVKSASLTPALRLISSMARFRRLRPVCP